MWDKPDALNAVASVLIAAALLAAAYAALHVVVRLPVFPLRQVVIRGQIAHVTAQQVEQIVERELKGNFFTLDLGEARAGFEKLPWVRRAQARKQWPGRLEITLEEHVPLARWGSSALVNSYGELFTAAYDGRLPVFTGPTSSAKEMTIQYGYFKRSLAAIGLAPVQVQLTPRRAWQLRADSGLVIELGRDQIEARLDRFVAMFERTMSHVRHKFVYADLRYPNGFALRVPESALKTQEQLRGGAAKRG